MKAVVDATGDNTEDDTTISLGEFSKAKHSLNENAVYSELYDKLISNFREIHDLKERNDTLTKQLDVITLNAIS